MLADHLVRGVLWPLSVFGVTAASFWRPLEHVGWVVFESVVLYLHCVRAAVVAADIPRHVIGDAGRLNQILINVLGNAVKFTETGRVVLRVAWENEARARLRFEGQDTGIGMTPATMDRLFQPFTQADADDAPLRRHRAGPGHQPQPGRRPGRQPDRHEHAGRGIHLPTRPAAGSGRRRGAHDHVPAADEPAAAAAGDAPA